MRTNPGRAVVLAVLVASAGRVCAQEAEKPLLSGPEVQDARPALVEETFGGEKMGKERMGAVEAIPAPDLRRILGAMAGEDADPALRLSSDQALKVRQLMQGYERERRAYLLEHREDLVELQRAAGVRAIPELAEATAKAEKPVEAMNEGERPPERARGAEGLNRMRMPGPAPEGEGMPAQEKATPEQDAARRELRAMMQAGPSMGDLQRRIYAELSVEQRAFVDAEVLRMGEERARERDMAQFERQRANRAAERQGAEPGTPAGNRAPIDWSKVFREDGSVNMEALPERVRQRLEGLSEAERKRAVETLKARYEEGRRLRSGD